MSKRSPVLDWTPQQEDDLRRATASNPQQAASLADQQADHLRLSDDREYQGRTRSLYADSGDPDDIPRRRR